MTISAETLRLLRRVRADLEMVTDVHARALTKAWASAWGELAVLFDAAALALAGMPVAVRAQSTRLNRALRHAAATLDRLADDAAATVTADLAAVAELTAAGEVAAIASQLPGRARARPVDPDMLDVMVRRVAEQITALTLPMSAEGTAAIRAALLRGTVEGANPRAIARDMLQRAETAFNGELSRALVISRTEILDAHRVAAALTQNANSDVLAGWTWLADLGPRCCSACWGQHGSVHPLSEPGPLDHHQGRCARAPLAKSWRELGFNIAEPPSVMSDARATFAAMPRADQLAVMGPARLDALDSGRIGWDDLATRRTTPGWRDSYAPTPVADLPL